MREANIPCVCSKCSKQFMGISDDITLCPRCRPNSSSFIKEKPQRSFEDKRSTAIKIQNKKIRETCMLEACKLGQIGEDPLVTIKRAEAYFEFIIKGDNE